MGAWCPPPAAAAALPAERDEKVARRPLASPQRDQRKPAQVYRSVPAHRTGVLKTGGILKKREQPRARPASAKRGWFCERRSRPQTLVTFTPSVRVTEFSRELDGGGTVPFDGTLLSLGLGKALRVKASPLAQSSPYEKPIEERAWVPLRQRIRLLRKAMGDARYFRSWVRCRREVTRIKKSRACSNNNNDDRELMPTSFEEARSRALALSHEVQAQPASSALPSAAPSTPTSVDKGRKRRRSFTGDRPESPLSERSPQVRKLAATSPEHSSPASKQLWGLLLEDDDKEKASQTDIALPCNFCGQPITEERRLGRHCASCLLVPGELGGGAAAGA